MPFHVLRIKRRTFFSRRKKSRWLDWLWFRFRWPTIAVLLLNCLFTSLLIYACKTYTFPPSIALNLWNAIKIVLEKKTRLIHTFVIRKMGRQQIYKMLNVSVTHSALRFFSGSLFILECICTETANESNSYAAPPFDYLIAFQQNLTFGHPIE